jgi:AraC family transcriptional regulator
MIVEVSPSTHREYAARMNRVIDHIQAHLSDSLNLEQLASVACFSPFHFHRLFRAWMGETLQEFVHRLRLERAAQLLIFDPFRSISEIAAECGFTSSGAFARAFKQTFGEPASEWRKRKICETNRNGGEAEKDTFLGFSKAADTISRRQENPMTKIPFAVRVQEFAPETIAYIRHTGPYKGNTNLFRQLFTQLFAWAESRGLLGPVPRYLSIFQDNPNLTPAARQRLEVALVVPPGTAPKGEIGVRTTEGGLYATARVYVPLEDYTAQWDILVGDWLPGSGYQPDHRPALEFYLNNPETDPKGKYHVEICLPVRSL